MTSNQLCNILTYARDKKLSLSALHMLAYLHQHGEANMTDVAGSIGLSSANITGHTDRLVEMGYLVRVRQSGDRRGIHLQLTGIGRRVMETALAGPNLAHV